MCSISIASMISAFHDLVLPRDVLHLNLVFVRTGPRVFLCVGVHRREAVILCGTSCALVVFGIRIVSRLCSHRMHNSVLGLEPRLVLLVLVTVPCCLLDHVTVSDCVHQLVLIGWFVDLSPLSAYCPPPSLLRPRNDFSTSVVVRIASFGTVLSDSYSLMIPLPSLLALGHLLDLLLSYSEFLFISSNFLAFGVWSVLFWLCLCLRRYWRMSVPCVLLSVFALCPRQLLSPLQLTL